MPPRYDFVPLLRYLLVRLVRIAIGCGVTYQGFAKLLRQVYFEVGSDFEPVKGKPNSDSRVSLLTGLARREVRALRGQPTRTQEPEVSIERMVLDAWSSRLDLIDAEGNMLPLARTARQGGEVSFEALVEGISKDVRARSLLDEWLRKGFVVLDEKDRVLIARPASTHGMEGVAGAGLLVGEFVGDMLTGFECAHLLRRPVPGYCYQVVYGHRLSEESVQLVCAMAMREGSALANRINRLIVERETLDGQSPHAVRRVTFGFAAFPADGVVEPGLLDPMRRPGAGAPSAGVDRPSA